MESAGLGRYIMKELLGASRGTSQTRVWSELWSDSPEQLKLLLPRAGVKRPLVGLSSKHVNMFQKQVPFCVTCYIQYMHMYIGNWRSLEGGD